MREYSIENEALLGLSDPSPLSINDNRQNGHRLGFCSCALLLNLCMIICLLFTVLGIVLRNIALLLAGGVGIGLAVLSCMPCSFYVLCIWILSYVWLAYGQNVYRTIAHIDIATNTTIH